MSEYTTILETKRLILRPFDLQDVEPAYQMNLDREVSRYTGDGGVQSREEIRRRIEEGVLSDYRKYGFGRLAVVDKVTHQFLGFCGLKYLPEMDEVDIGFRFLKAYWGKGLATESGKAVIQHGFFDLKLQRIIGLVLPDNIKSIRVLQKLGLTFEKDIIVYDLEAKLFAIHAQR